MSGNTGLNKEGASSSCCAKATPKQKLRGFMLRVLCVTKEKEEILNN